jgi:2'-5' RNA ligase
MRTFVAIELDEECRRNLATAIEKMAHAVEGIKWVTPESAHLTLKFIGQLDEKDVPDALEVLESAAARARPFTMRVKGISAFPSKKKPRVIHAPVEESSGVLEELAEAVDAGLAEKLDIEREKRQFKPHITLGRTQKGTSCPPIEKLASEVREPGFGEVEVDEIVLMKSDLTPRGAIYTPLEHVPLTGG